MSHLRRFLAAAVLATAAAGLGGVATAPSASASTCSTGSGVSVVVDFGALGGGVKTACVSGGGGQYASSLFPSAGFDLAFVQNEPGFVCRIDGLPGTSGASATPCVNTPPENAYWALFWSDGTSGSWNYSNYGVGSLRVPDGAYVGFSWSTGSRSVPGVAPAPHAASPTSAPATPTPTSKPSSKPTKKPSGSPSGRPTPKPTKSPTTVAPPTTAVPSATTTAAPTDAPTATPTTGAASDPAASSPTDPAASATAGATDPAVPTDSASPTDEVSTAPTAGTSDGSDASDGALPAWMVPVVIALLALIGAGITLLRRRHRASP